MGESMMKAMEAILDGCTLAELRRAVYKHTACGPWVSFKLHDGTWNHSGDDLTGVGPGDVRSWQVGSIVEGVDNLDLKEPERDLMVYTEDKDPAQARDDFYADVECINKAADDVWRQTHGCDGCAKLWVAEGFDPRGGEWAGYVAVHEKCPDCAGDGVVM